MSSAELSEWLAYSRVECLPDAHWDAASISYTIACAHAEKGTEPRFETFYPKPAKTVVLSKADLKKSLIARFRATRKPRADAPKAG